MTPAWNGSTEPEGLDWPCPNAFCSTSEQSVEWGNKEFMQNFDEKTFCVTITWGAGSRWKHILMNAPSEALTAVLVQPASLLMTSCRLVVTFLRWLLPPSSRTEWSNKRERQAPPTWRHIAADWTLQHWSMFREQRLRLVAHVRTIWRAWALAGSHYRNLPESYDTCFCTVWRFTESTSLRMSTTTERFVMTDDVAQPCLPVPLDQQSSIAGPRAP